MEARLPVSGPELTEEKPPYTRLHQIFFPPNLLCLSAKIGDAMGNSYPTKYPSAWNLGYPKYYLMSPWGSHSKAKRRQSCVFHQHTTAVSNYVFIYLMGRPAFLSAAGEGASLYGQIWPPVDLQWWSWKSLSSAFGLSSSIKSQKPDCLALGWQLQTSVSHFQFWLAARVPDSHGSWVRQTWIHLALRCDLEESIFSVFASVCNCVKGRKPHVLHRNTMRMELDDLYRNT